MKQQRDNLAGEQTITEPYELWGKVTGDVRVIAGGKFYHRGAIYGDLIVQEGGRVHIFGHISGDLYVFENTKVIHSGLIGGNAYNEGGRLFIDRDGIVHLDLTKLHGVTPLAADGLSVPVQAV